MGRSWVIACALLVMWACGSSAPRVDGEPDWEPAKKKDIRVSLIKTLIDSGAYTSSVPLLRQGLAENPKDPRLHYLMGSVLRERALYEQAIASFEKAIALSPNFAQAYSGMAITLNMKDQHEPALLLHEKAVQLGPKDARLHNNLGFALSLVNRHQAAAKSYQNALAIDPNMRSAYVNLGFSLGLLGDDDASKKAFAQVLKNAEVLNNLALVKELRGDQQGAVALYKEALAAQPGLVVARENLEAVNSEMDNKKESR